MMSKPAIQQATARPRRIGQRLQVAGHGEPRAHGGDADREAQREMAEPRHPLRERVEDERRDRDGPQHPRLLRQLGHRDEQDGEADGAEREYLPIARRARRQLPGGGARVRRVDVGVDDPVQGHRERPRADHGEQDPAERGDAAGSPSGRGTRPRARTAARRSCARSARTTAGRAPARAPRPAEPPLRSWSPSMLPAADRPTAAGPGGPGHPGSIGFPGMDGGWVPGTVSGVVVPRPLGPWGREVG